MISIVSFIRSFTVTFPPAEGTDIAGYVVHACPTSEFIGGDLVPTEANLIYKGPDPCVFYTIPPEKLAGMWGVKVAAYDTFGLDELNYSELYTVMISSLDPLDQVPPEIPTGLILTTTIENSAQVDNVSITAAWLLNPVPADFSNFIVAHKKTTDEDFIEAFTAEPTCTVTGLIAGMGYDFKVRAVDLWNNASDWTAIVSIVAAKDSVPPAAVTDVVVEAGMKKVIIHFPPVTDADLAGYEVHVSTIDGFTPSEATLISSGNTTLHSYDGEVDTTYYVKVRAYDQSGNFSDYSPQVSAKTMFVVTQDLVDDIITSAKIATGAVTEDGIATNAITETKISENAITTPKIAANAITADEIATGAVIAGKIAAGAVTATTIQAGAITADKLTTGEVITLSAQIKDATVTTAKISDLSADKITAGTLSAATTINVGDNKIKLDGTNSRITVANNAGTVTDMVAIGKLNTGNYGISVKDKDGLQVFKVDENGAAIQNLTAGTIDANKVTLNNLVVGNNVTMGPNAYINWVNVTSKPTIPTNTNQLTDGAGLGTTAIWDSVSNPYGTKPANNANNTYIDSTGRIQGVSSGSNTVVSNPTAYSQTTAPSSPKLGDTWFNSATTFGNGYVPNTGYTYNGSSWVMTTPKGTYIDANGIYTGTLIANQVNTSGFVAQTANIGDAQVQTLQIAGNAVTVPASASTPASTGNGTIQTLTITLDMDIPLLILVTATVLLRGNNLVLFKVLRNGSPILDTSGTSGIIDVISASVADMPGIGTHTYTLYAWGGTATTYSNRTILALGIKR